MLTHQNIFVKRSLCATEAWPHFLSPNYEIIDFSRVIIWLKVDFKVLNPNYKWNVDWVIFFGEGHNKFQKWLRSTSNQGLNIEDEKSQYKSSVACCYSAFFSNKSDLRLIVRPQELIQVFGDKVKYRRIFPFEQKTSIFTPPPNSNNENTLETWTGKMRF